MKALTFKNKRVADSKKFLPGVGQFDVNVDFVPNFIEVHFRDVRNQPFADSLSWSLAATATGYTLTVYYAINEVRHIKWVIAKLPVDPEATINF